jgi:ribosomal subunit interface protein
MDGKASTQSALETSGSEYVSKAISWNIVNKNVSPGLMATEKLKRKVSALSRHLGRFPPDTVHLQVALEKLAKKRIYKVTFTLRLPSNILHAEKTSHDLIGAIDDAVAALERELIRLKSQLRGDYRWKRPVYRAKLEADKTILFSEPMPSGTGPQTRTDVVADLLGAQYEQLKAHAARSIRMAELAGEIPHGALEAGELVDEVARVCLEKPDAKQSELTYELWFYQLLGKELARRREALQGAVSGSATSVSGAHPPLLPADEAEGYDAENPLDLITGEIEPAEDLPEEKIADSSNIGPDSAAAIHEVVRNLQQAAKHWPQLERKIFELHYFSGFDTGEIAMVLSCRKEEVEVLLDKIQLRFRDYLRECALVAHEQLRGLNRS